ncbi:AAA family ATPase [Armatimonas sp.]|uniref:AAA family ATPase n=1 Tax=Armatimonas sp. TaxID=1872638 RepID=UPI0037526933
MLREHEPAVVTVTFLCTDIVGSTRLWQESGALMRERLSWHDARVQELAQRFGGDAFKARGDGFFIAFPTALVARDMAVTLQKALVQEFGDTFQIRTVLSTGEAQHREGDYFGLALSRAARVLELSHGTQLVLTETSARLIEEVEPAATAQLKDLGTHQLRSIEHPERLFQLIIPGLPTQFPPFSNASLPPHNLPRTLTSFIGREKEYASVEGLLSKTRLLSILGPGGSGKTRLSLQVGDELLMRYPGGVWFVDLAPVADGALFARAVAAALRVREDAGADLMETLLSHLAPRNTLLILDNCEHLVGAAAHFAQQVLVHCSEVTILATSREALGLTGEVAWPLPGLALPPESVTKLSLLMRYEAIQLFVERATAVSPGFRLTSTNGASVARICRRLDGIPLALELAAAWISALSPEQIDQHLLDKDFLESVDPTAPQRQRTLQGTMDWSHGLLTVPEQTLWRRISVFAGSFTQAAAGAVCTDDLLPAPTALRALRGLVRKSILLHDSTSTNRYRLLETVREYGLEKLNEANELPAFRLRHLEHYTALAEEAEPHLRGPEQKTWLDRLEAEHPNLRVALTRPENGDLALRLATAIFWFWRVRQHFTEGIHFLNSLLTAHQSVNPALQARAMRALGILSMETGALSEAEQALVVSQRIFESLGDLADATTIAANLGILAINRGNFSKAKMHLNKAIQFYRDTGDKPRVAMLLTNLGCAIMDEGIPEYYHEAEKNFRESYAIDMEISDITGRLSNIFNISYTLYKMDRFNESKERMLEFLKLSEANNILSGQVKGIFHLVKIRHSISSDDQEIVPLLGKINQLIAQGNSPLDESEIKEYNDLTHTLCGRLGASEYQQLFDQGAQLSFNETLKLIESGTNNEI